MDTTWTEDSVEAKACEARLLCSSCNLNISAGFDAILNANKL
jgi:ferredoxin